MRPWLLIAGMLAGCSSPALHDENEADHHPAAGHEEAEEAGASRESQQAALQLEIARLQARLGALEAAAAVKEAEQELASAEAALQLFTAHGLPQRLAEAELEVQGGIDEVQDYEEELAQLEQMFGADELAKATEDIVLQRARRQLERARQELELVQAARAALKGSELPQEQAELEAAAAQARAALDGARLSRKLAELEGRAAVAEAEQELEDASEGDEE